VWILLAVVLVATALAAGCALIVVGEARVKSIPALSIAVFGTFLTSMAIIAAFSIEEGSRWPTPWEVLDRAHVPVWFLVALGSVVAALLAGATDSAFLSAFSLTLALTAVPLGTWGLWGLIALSSDQGRWRLVVELLTESILAAPSPRSPTPPDLGEIDTEDHVPDSFLIAGDARPPRGTGVAIGLVPAVLREYADRRDLEAIVGLIDEVHASARAALERSHEIDAGDYLRSIDSLLAVQRSIYEELANRVLAGQLGDATARIALARAGEAALDVAGRARRPDPGTAWDASAAEAIVARHLTALARFAGHVAGEADGRLGVGAPPAAAGVAGRSGEQAGALALRGAAVELQQAIRWAIDPDPPGMKIPPEHPWRAGLSDPEAALVWLWSTTESASGPFGVGQYAACEILTGKKFFESYWDGFDVFTEISRRLGPGEREGGDRENGRNGEAIAASREAVARAGGLERLSLELAASRLAATPPRVAGAPAYAGDPRRLDERHAACNLFLAGAGYKPPGRDPVADLAWLLTDRLCGSLWTTVFDQLSLLSDRVLTPPLQPLHRRPEACALAVVLRLTPLDEEPSEASLAAARDFIGLLSDPLLGLTAELAVALTGMGREPLPAERELRRERLLEAARFARKVTPGPFPARTPGTPAWEQAPRLGECPGGFAEGLEEIAAAGAEVEVDVVQCDRRWLEDWAEARAWIDAELLAGALRGRVHVRRIVLYDLARDASRRDTRLHYRWTESLAAAVRCFPRREAGASRYEVRRLIVPAAGAVEVPADAVFVRRPGEPADAGFERLWSRPDGAGDRSGALGLIEL
jgi:hypothetical protein